MTVPSWFVEYGAVLLVGLIVGLLLRTVVVTVVVLVGVLAAAVLVGYVSSPGVATGVREAFSLAGQFGASAGLVLTVAGLVFLFGVVAGLLMTTPLPGLGRPRPF